MMPACQLLQLSSMLIVGARQFVFLWANRLLPGIVMQTSRGRPGKDTDRN
jgi:hypothetical protein